MIVFTFLFSKCFDHSVCLLHDQMMKSTFCIFRLKDANTKNGNHFFGNIKMDDARFRWRRILCLEWQQLGRSGRMSLWKYLKTHARWVLFLLIEFISLAIELELPEKRISFEHTQTSKLSVIEYILI